MDIEKTQKAAMHEFYLASRKLLNAGVVPPICVQRSFESALSGILGENCWRPTHMSPAAAQEIVRGFASSVQRAHGVLNDRLDRYDRTIQILTSPAQEFEDWWEFYKKHDATVLITREEHSTGRRFVEKELIPIPHDARGLFINSGFSFKMRKKVELKWVKQEILNHHAQFH